jgi:hypothetical protein
MISFSRKDYTRIQNQDTPTPSPQKKPDHSKLEAWGEKAHTDKKEERATIVRAIKDWVRTDDPEAPLEFNISLTKINDMPPLPNPKYLIINNLGNPIPDKNILAIKDTYPAIRVDINNCQLPKEVGKFDARLLQEGKRKNSGSNSMGKANVTETIDLSNIFQNNT